MKINKLILGIALRGALFAFTQKAGALTIGDSHELGFINYGIPTGDANQTAYVNYLKSMVVGTTEFGVVVTGFSQDFTRSANVFSPLETAVLASGTTYGNLAVSTVDIDLGTGGFLYLTAKYDGPNFGTEVWHVGGLNGIITIPSFGGGYGISGSRLYTPGTGTGTVPDGGSTVLLLGAAVSGLGMVARRFKK